MALDPNIILSGKSPEVLGADERLMNLLKLRSGEMDNQVKQNSLNDYLSNKKTVSDRQNLFKTNPNITSEQYISQTGDFEGAKGINYFRKSNLDIQGTEYDNAKKVTALTGQAFGSVMGLPDEQIHSGANQAIDMLVQNGAYTPEYAIQAKQHLTTMQPQQLRQFAEQGYRSALDADKQFELNKPKELKAPTSRIVRIGNDQVTQEFDATTGQWNEVGRGGAYAPDKPAEPQKVDYNKPFLPDGTPNKPYQDYEKDKKDQVKLKTVPAAISTAIVSNKQALSKLDNAIKLLEGNDVGTDDAKMLGDKDATGLKGVFPPIILNRLDPKGTDARAQVADIGSLIIHDRSGAAVTVSEAKRLTPFIPNAADDNVTALKKLRRLREMAKLEDDVLANQYNEDAGYKMPNGDKETTGASQSSGKSKVINGTTYVNDGKGWKVQR